MGWRDRNPWQEATRLRIHDRIHGRIPGLDGTGTVPAPLPDLPPAPTLAGTALERLVYVSRSAPCLETAAVYEIIRRAHAGNGPAGVTGALVFLDGWFVQVLEGPGATLDAWLGRIRRDPRHADLQIRCRERVHARVFAGQPMALRTRACLDPGLLDSFDYRPGFPVADFPADILVEFVVQACRRRRPT